MRTMGHVPDEEGISSEIPRVVGSRQEAALDRDHCGMLIIFFSENDHVSTVGFAKQSRRGPPPVNTGRAKPSSSNPELSL